MLGQRIKKTRTKLNMSQVELAKRVGISSNRLSEIESGKGNPNKSLLIAIEQLFNISPDWLETGEGEMFINENKTEKEVGIDREQLKKIAIEVENILDENNAAMPIDKKMEMIFYIYDDEKENGCGNIKSIVEKLLKFVA